MGYIEENLIAGENILYRTRLHWIAMLGPGAVSVLLAAAAFAFAFGAIANQDSSRTAMIVAALIVLASAVAVFGWGAWHRSSTEMAVTNKRVLVKVGMISRNTTEMMLSKIESVVVDQGILGRMLNYGTITVRGTGGTPEPFAKIAHPLEFRRQIQQQLDKMQSQFATASV